MDAQHNLKLMHLFETARIQTLYAGIRMELHRGECRITYPISEQMFHGGGALHGSVYFKMLDDAAYFAAATFEPQFFLLTARFTINLLKPLHSGTITAIGSCQETTGKRFQATAKLLDAESAVVAEGSGLFLPSSKPWGQLEGYR